MTSARSWRWASVAADRGAAGGEQHLQGGSLRAGLGGGQPGPGQGVAGGAFGVDHIGLRPVSAGGADRAVELDDQLAPLGEVAGQPGAVAAGAFHRPPAEPAVLLGEGEQLGVAVRVGSDGGGGQHRAGLDRDQRGSVGVGVGVHADDELDQFCQHGHAFSLLRADVTTGPVRYGDRQDCDGTPRAATRGSSS